MDRFESALCIVEPEFWEPIRKLVGQHLAGQVVWRGGCWMVVPPDQLTAPRPGHGRLAPNVGVALSAAESELRRLVPKSVEMRVLYGVVENDAATPKGEQGQYQPNAQREAALKLMRQRPHELWPAVYINEELRKLPNPNRAGLKLGYVDEEGLRKNVLQHLDAAGLAKFDGTDSQKSGWRLTELGING